jgi:transposase
MAKGSKQPPRQRRSFTPEFKAEAVRLVLEEQKSVSQVSKDLDLTPSSLGGWVEQARADVGTSGRGTLTSDEREELARLRRENRELKMQKEILKKAAAFFAKENG